MEVKKAEIQSINSESPIFAGTVKVLLESEAATVHMTLEIRRNGTGQIFPYLPAVGEEAALIFARPIWWKLVEAVRSAYKRVVEASPEQLIENIETAKSHAAFFREFVLPGDSEHDSQCEVETAESKIMDLTSILDVVQAA
jgi:hypothetical protein